MADLIHDMVCIVSKYNIRIKDGYKITNKREMAEILYVIQHRHPECEVFQVRKWNNLIREWVSHNRLFKLGLFKQKTQHVDLDVYESWWRKLLYNIIGL